MKFTSAPNWSCRSLTSIAARFHFVASPLGLTPIAWHSFCRFPLAASTLQGAANTLEMFFFACGQFHCFFHQIIKGRLSFVCITTAREDKIVWGLPDLDLHLVLLFLKRPAPSMATCDKNGHEYQARAFRDSNAFILPGSTNSCASWSHYGHTTGTIRARPKQSRGARFCPAFFLPFFFSGGGKSDVGRTCQLRVVYGSARS